MTYTYPQKVLFKHCDPAGIVFYPRYFEMMNDAIEAMFADVLGWPFEELHSSGGVPTAHIDITFKAPSRHGDELILSLHPGIPGGASLGIGMRATCGDALRFESHQTLVFVDDAGKPTRWPDTMREKLLQIQGDRNET